MARQPSRFRRSSALFQHFFSGGGRPSFLNKEKADTALESLWCLHVMGPANKYSTRAAAASKAVRDSLGEEEDDKKPSATQSPRESTKVTYEIFAVGDSEAGEASGSGCAGLMDSIDEGPKPAPTAGKALARTASKKGPGECGGKLFRCFLLFYVPRVSPFHPVIGLLTLCFFCCPHNSLPLCGLCEKGEKKHLSRSDRRRR